MRWTKASLSTSGKCKKYLVHDSITCSFSCLFLIMGRELIISTKRRMTI